MGFVAHGEQPLLDRLSRLDTCAISDALDRLALPGVTTGLRRVVGSGVIAAPVATIRLALDDGRGSARHLGTALLNSLEPGVAILVANDGRKGAGAWGGLLGYAARLRGAAGVVVDGAVRDVDQIDAQGLPVYARAITPRSARGRYVEAEHQRAVQVGDLRVEPDDLVVADGSGVVFVPKREALRVLQAAEEISTVESEMARALEDGALPSCVLSGRYEKLTRHDR